VFGGFNIHATKNSSDIQYEITDIRIVGISFSTTTRVQTKSNSNTMDIIITEVNTYTSLPIKN